MQSADAGISTVNTIETLARQLGLHVLVSPGHHDDWDRIDAAPLDAAGMHVLA